jgi:hypothetical protein
LIHPSFYLIPLPPPSQTIYATNNLDSVGEEYIHSSTTCSLSNTTSPMRFRASTQTQQQLCRYRLRTSNCTS